MKTENEIIWYAIKKLQLIMKDDFHGFVSEIYSVLSKLCDEVKHEKE